MKNKKIRDKRFIIENGTEEQYKALYADGLWLCRNPKCKNIRGKRTVLAKINIVNELPTGLVNVKSPTGNSLEILFNQIKNQCNRCKKENYIYVALNPDNTLTKIEMNDLLLAEKTAMEFLEENESDLAELQLLKQWQFNEPLKNRGPEPKIYWGK